MSNRRRLRPHEIARRDQSLAWARDHAASGDLVMIVESTPPGRHCCWCDCPDTPDSQHITNPRYVCASLCAEPATHVVRMHGPRPIHYLVCERHKTGPMEQLISLGLVESVVFGPSWKDDD